MDQKPAPPPTGELIDIGGYRLHLRRRGAGSPAVVMDAGLGTTSLLYEPVLPPIASFTTACAFDRAGYAWSDPAPAGVSRSSRQLVAEQRTLLQTAGLAPPYVLVGNSFGAINSLVYAGLYPDEVAGMVLVDPSHPEMFERVPGVPSPRAIARMAQVMTGVARLGIAGLFTRLLWTPVIPGWRNLPAEIWSAQRYFNARPASYETWRREAADGAESFRQARELTRQLGDRPLIVLTGGAFWTRRGSRRWEAMKQAMLVLREELATLSTRGVHRMVDGASHTMQVDHPDAVAEAVREVVDAAQQR